MTRIQLIVLALAFIILPAETARAGRCSSARCNDTRIKRIYPNQQGDVLIEPRDGGQVNLSVCTAVSGKYLVLERSHAAFEVTLQLLLTAQLAGKAVSFRMYPESPGQDCRIAYVTLDD